MCHSEYVGFELEKGCQVVSLVVCVLSYCTTALTNVSPKQHSLSSIIEYEIISQKLYIILPDRKFLDAENMLFVYCVSNVSAPRQPSGRVLASSAGGPGFNPKSRTASYQRCYKNCTIEKGNTGSFSRIKIRNNVMDKIWYRNPSKSKVISRCGGYEKND